MSADRKIAWSSRIIKSTQQHPDGVRTLTPPPADRGITDTSELMSADGPASEAARALINEAQKQAEDMLQDAASRADLMLDEAREEAEELRRQAKEQGIREGRKQGRHSMHRQMRASLEEIQRWHEQLKVRNRRRVEHLTGQLAELVVQLVQKALERTMQQKPEWVVTMVTETLKKYSEIGDVTLTTCPGDLLIILDNREELERHLPPRADLLLNTADDLQPGEFRLQSDEGAFDVTADDLSESLRRVLQENYHPEQEDDADESDR